MAQRTKIGQLLFEKGHITADQLQKALTEQHRAGLLFGQYVVQQGWVDETVIADILSAQLGIARFSAEAHQIGHTTKNLLPQELASSHRVAPLAVKGALLAIAMPYPMDIKAIESVEFHTNLEVEPVICTETELQQLLSEIYADKSGLRGGWEKDIFAISPGSDNALDLFEEPAATGAATRTALNLLESALDTGSTEVHLFESPAGHVVLQREKGVLAPVAETDKETFSLTVDRLASLAGLSAATPGSGYFSFDHRGAPYTISAYSLPSVHGRRLACCMSPCIQATGVNGLGLHEDDAKRMNRILALPGGLIVCCSLYPGLTKALQYSLLQHLQSNNLNIISLEQLIETHLSSIHQCVVGPSPSAALHAAVSMRPDMLSFESGNDAVIVQEAVKAANMGVRTVLGVQAANTQEALYVLTGCAVPAASLSNMLRCIATIAAVPANCSECAQEYSPSADALAALGLAKVQNARYKKGVGCSYCHNTGLSKAVAITEILWMHDPLREPLSKNDISATIASALQSKSLRRLRSEAARKTVKGLVTAENAVKALYT